ncbi:MAG TPA: hypothetical protein PKN61_07775 [Acidobacteriota bacterium]|jgi:DNA-directed RNA polymerase subunit RPC12/RpoP|nr:hypothetical protein [Acidobacteriota bacterium]HNR38922.1 hypothetical protein [Acidobacteriota bacterium]HNU00588.1 hypothetical protein [Acidobacteriota bacterium]HPB29615.1 hypothetical protein [Acidobacteriota bacterium]HQO24411.1 hypothetical protein [Acidobacteriota bacterium]
MPKKKLKKQSLPDTSNSEPARDLAAGHAYMCLRCGALYESVHPPFPVGGLNYNYARPDDDPAYDGVGQCGRCGGPLSLVRTSGAHGRMA